MEVSHDFGSPLPRTCERALKSSGLICVSNMIWHVGQSMSKLGPDFFPSATMCAFCLIRTWRPHVSRVPMVDFMSHPVLCTHKYRLRGIDGTGPLWPPTAGAQTVTIPPASARRCFGRPRGPGGAFRGTFRRPGPCRPGRPRCRQLRRPPGEPRPRRRTPARPGRGWHPL